MKSTHLFQLMQAISPPEMREARKFLASPWFNTREDLLGLFDFLASEAAPTKEETWRRLFPDEPFDDQKLRLLTSYLHKLLERFISIGEWKNDEQTALLQLAAGYRRRGLRAPFERARRRLESELERQPLRDAHYFYLQHRLQWEQTQVETAENPAESMPLHALSRSLDLFYLSSRLRLICLAAAQQGVYPSGAQAGIEREILALAERDEWRNLPAIALYLHCYRLLERPEEESHFQRFKELLLETAGLFSTEEMRGLYLFAINYCIRRLNDGEKRFFSEALDLYKPGLEHGFLLENGVLSRFTYHNIAAAGLQSGELDWVNQFIHEYKNALERQYRESSFSFNLARLEYSRKRRGAVLELLQKANYRDPLLNLAAKTLLLKTYFELGEYDLLQSHLDAMRNYIRRKRVIGYHRANYLNIVRYAEKLLKLNNADKKAVAALKRELIREEILTERDWLLECLV
jgi:hypothetical protein